MQDPERDGGIWPLPKPRQATQVAVTPGPLPRLERVAAMVIGVAAGVGGSIAVFVTTNGTGSAALFVVALAFLLMGVTGLPITSLKLPGGGQVDLAAQKLGEDAKRIVQTEDPDERKQLTTNLFVDAGRVANVPDPVERAQEITDTWTELGELVQVLKTDLSRAHVEFRSIRGEQVPRIVATVDGIDYGLYVMAGTRQSVRWVGLASAAAGRVNPPVTAVLALEVPPDESVRAEASRLDVGLTWRQADGRWANSPWQTPGGESNEAGGTRQK